LGMVRHQPSSLSFLAFVSDEWGIYQVYRILPDGSHLKRITDFQEGRELRITWSPNAHWLAIDATSQIYITSIDGQKFQKISPDNDDGSATSPIWSPDSTTLVYWYSDGKIAIELFQVSDYQQENIAQGWEDWVGFGQVGWLSDSQSLLVLVLASHGVNTEIYLVSRDGKIIRQITHNQDYRYSGLTMSPDHQWLLFVDDDSLYSMKVDGSQTTRLFTGDISYGLSWSPDSQWIIFSAHQDDELELYSIHRNGKNLLQLTNEDIFSPLSWSPDSQWLAYMGEEGIYKIRRDGTDKQKLLHVRCNDQYTDVVWSPDGQWLAYVAGCVSKTSLYLISPDGKKRREIYIDQPGDVDTLHYYPLEWSPIIDLDWHSSILAALGCGAIVLGYLRKPKFSMRRRW
jgi:Tol biopolymer transport system component